MKHDLTKRYFVADSAEQYDALRSQLDAAEGFPNGRADQSIVPAKEAMEDEEGKYYVAFRQTKLPELAAKLAERRFVEVSKEAYRATAELARASGMMTAEPKPVNLPPKEKR